MLHTRKTIYKTLDVLGNSYIIISLPVQNAELSPWPGIAEKYPIPSKTRRWCLSRLVGFMAYSGLL